MTRTSLFQFLINPFESVRASQILKKLLWFSVKNFGNQIGLGNHESQRSQSRLAKDSALKVKFKFSLGNLKYDF